jgi:hypothetical protein
VSNLTPFSGPIEAQKAFEDYLGLGQQRSVMALYRMYTMKVSKDPTAFVPTTSMQTLVDWESVFGWKAMAYEYDAEEHNAFFSARLETLTKMYENQIRIAKKLNRKAFKALMNLNESELNPQDIIKYLTEANKMMSVAMKEKLALIDPRESSGSGSQDVFDAVRKILMVQGNEVHIHGGSD